MFQVDINEKKSMTLKFWYKLICEGSLKNVVLGFHRES